MNFFRVAGHADVKNGEAICVQAGGVRLALVRTGGSYHALENLCPHRGGQICDGSVDAEKNEIVCPLHGWNFDINTGASPYNPQDRIRKYRAESRDDGVYVEIPEGERRPQLTGYLDPWRKRLDDIEKDMEMIHHMADGWIGEHGYTEPMRTEKQPPLWDSLVFLPRQLASFPVGENDPVSLETVIGAGAKKPITISLPVYVSHMSFGALSKEAKTALAAGSKMAGTLICSGEGGMLTEERENAGTYILEMASGYFGWTEEAIARADGLEIKMGQAAKAGMGGMLPAGKVTKEIAEIRRLKPGQDAISPAGFRDMASVKDIKKRVSELKAMTGGKPVGIKFAAGRVEEDLSAALECEPDFITIDGRGGATASAPKHVKDNICIPTLYALDRARTFCEKRGIRTDIIITGGLRLPPDFAKAIALGATAVACATASLVAIGCQQYRACHTGNCPVGIATQKEELRKRLDVDKSAAMLANFLQSAKYQLADFARICGHRNIHELNPGDLATTSDEVARYTSIQHVGAGL